VDEEIKRRLELVEGEVKSMQESSRVLQMSMVSIDTKLSQLVTAVEKISAHAEESIKTSIVLKSVSDDVEILFEKMRSRDALFIKSALTIITTLTGFFIWYVQKGG